MNAKDKLSIRCTLAMFMGLGIVVSGAWNNIAWVAVLGGSIWIIATLALLIWYGEHS